MAEYRDPKVTNVSTPAASSRRWVWIAAAVIALLLLAWLAGLFGDDAAETEPMEPAASSAPATTAPTTTAPAAPTGGDTATPAPVTPTPAPGAPATTNP